MTENLEFLDGAEWKVPWGKPPSAAPPSTCVHHGGQLQTDPPNDGPTTLDAMFGDSDDSMLEQLDIPQLDVEPSPEQGNSFDCSDDPEESCMNTAVLLNTEAMDAFASPMPPLPDPVPVSNTSVASFKRKSSELATPIRVQRAVEIKRRQIFTRTPIILPPEAPSPDDNGAAASQLPWDMSDAHAGEFFRTQFLRQVDSLSGDQLVATQSAHRHQDGLSQFFRGTTQFDAPTSGMVGGTQRLRAAALPAADDVAADGVQFGEDGPAETGAEGRLDELQQEPVFSADTSGPSLTQLLAGVTQPFEPAVVARGTQRFLRDIRSVQSEVAAAASQQQLQLAPAGVVAAPVTIYTNAEQATAYIELQRAASEQNEQNVGDDDFLDPELSQAYRSTQYRREVEAVFRDCERSICEVKVAEVGGQVQVEAGSAADGDENGGQMAAADEHDLRGVSWTQTDFAPAPLAEVAAEAAPPAAKTPAAAAGNAPRTPLITPSVFVRQRIEELRRVATPRRAPVTPPTASGVLRTSFVGLGPFFGLPMRVRSLIRDYKGISELYDWQKQCLSLPAISRRNNLIYALPTSGGKTLVSEILILREVLCRRRNCLFILPYVSIVQEKMWSLSPFAVELDFLLEEYAAGKGRLPPQRRRRKRSIYVATIEKGLALLDSLIEAGRANELGLIVVDELHIIGEAGRGAALETLLTKAMYIEAGIQIVGMSATIGNLPELAQFLRADVFTRDFRPVELREYIKCGDDVMLISDSEATGGKSFEFVRSVDFRYRADVQRRDPDHLAGLVSEVIPAQSCLVFCPTKANCENVALLLSEMLPRKYREHKAEQRAELRRFLEAEGATLCGTLARTIPYGIAYHHSGLTGEERRHLEDAFRQNILCVICCTSTLAAGVNLPAKRVILRSPYVGREFITLSRYKQMVGRAGRAGLCGDVGESILICGPQDNVRVGQLLCSPMDEAASSLHAEGGRGVQALVLSAIGLGMAATRAELERLVGATLMAVQAERLGVQVAAEVSAVLGGLFRAKTLQLQETPGQSQDTQPAASANITAASASQQHIRLKPATRMTISQLGRASFKSGFDVAKARAVYRDLHNAQRSLVLSTYLHLLYVVTPYEAAAVGVRPQSDVYYTLLSARLGRAEQDVAQMLGITQQVALRIRAEKPLRCAELERTVGRFFMTLMMWELWQQRGVPEVAVAFGVSRGVVQSLVTAAASYASGVLRCCEELEEFWGMRELLRLLTARLSYCCAAELVPLMELPAVKLARAKQLYAAGFRTLEHIAKADAQRLIDSVEHLNMRVARQLIAAAKVLLLERVESLREEVQDCLEVLEGKPK